MVRRAERGAAASRRCWTELSGAFGGQVRVFRQQRDLRFTPDKSPYKTRTYGVLQGVPGAVAGLYAQLSARGLYAGTGYHELARDQLERFRAAVADDITGPTLTAAAAAAEHAGLELAGESLRTAPRGHPRDHPRIDLLRRRQLIAGRALRARADRPRCGARPRRRHLARGRTAQRVARRARRGEQIPTQGRAGGGTGYSDRSLKGATSLERSASAVVDPGRRRAAEAGGGDDHEDGSDRRRSTRATTTGRSRRSALLPPRFGALDL